MPNERPLPLLSWLRHLGGLPRTSSLSDGQLLARYLAERDESAFETLLARHGPLVWGVCRRCLPRRQDQEDAFQATFLVLVRQGHAIRQQESVRSWLYGVAFRIARRLRLSTASHALRADMEDVPARATRESQAWRELQPLLDEELQHLPEKYRLPLLLCYLEGKSRDEAAQALGWSLNQVKKRLEQGRDRLRQRLTRRGVTLSAALLPAALSQVSQAAPPAMLRTVTVQAVAHQVVSPTVSLLVKGVLQSMFWTKMKNVVAAVAVITLLATGGGWWLYKAAAVPISKPVEKQDHSDQPMAAQDATKANDGKGDTKAKDDKGAIKVTLNRQWQGRTRDGSLLKELRACGAITNKQLNCGVITDVKAWDRLWKAWRFAKDLPSVDFDKELVLVVTVPGYNLIQLQSVQLSAKGELTYRLISTRVGGGGFGFLVATVDRAGIRTVRNEFGGGDPVSVEKAPQPRSPQE